MAAVIQQQFPSEHHHHRINDPAVPASRIVSHHHHNPRHADNDKDATVSSSTLSPLPHSHPRSSTVAEIQTQARLPAGRPGDDHSRPGISRPTSATAPAAPNAAVDRGSRIPSPPSSSPAASVGPKYMTDDAAAVHMASHVAATNPPLGHAVPSSASTSNPENATAPSSQLQAQQAEAQVPAHQQQQQPSPPNDDFQIPNDASQLARATAVAEPAQTVIHIRDLAHIQSLAKADLMGGQSSAGGILNDTPLQQMKYEISGMPIGDVIEMVAALLTKITTTNDLQHDAMQRNAVHQQQAGQSGDSNGSQMSPLSHSVLAFHGKNVPGITILSYLSRIHKYCPTTYEVFLGLLVYFDRMTERVNDMVSRSEQQRRRAATQSGSSSRPQSHHQSQDLAMADKDNSLADTDESDSDLADDDDDDDDDDEMADSSGAPSRAGSAKVTAPPPETPVPTGPATYFVVDSFNIHRLIIAGVTCASKFFSDVFYTNSRYAKVGGLPLVELNHLELQFLLLNDFRLAVPVEDLEAYATMLVEFYAREVVASKGGARGA